MKLYEITKDMLQLQQMLEDGSVDIEAIKDTIESIDGSFEEKIEDTVKVIRNLEASAKAIDLEIKRLESMKKERKANAKGLKEYIRTNMDALEKRSVSAGIFKVSISKNAHTLKVLDESFIPEEYFVKQDSVINRELILEKLKQDVVIPGVGLNQTESLSIR
ncbi:hypothetical protein BK128_08385 [Viridibacillus sp. FSL H7-0596]|uniref:siphovirus Gp157 family protein n=1 Tax=Viridibacillus sp. FSL H7-0596 TaxID=1928923 RepID=UPI00096CC8EF|nr:siphovirus Gp157 family protein [Viridibacillus sp. FSL H7-0596]OMC87434.1 hypothetical protein BK128_08385 [Viridibacillus sp. FSL H7-0596]